MRVAVLTILILIAVLTALVSVVKSEEAVCSVAEVKYEVVSTYCDKVYTIAETYNVDTALINVETAKDLLNSTKALIERGKCKGTVFKNLAHAYVLCHRAYIEVLKVQPNLWYNISKGLCEEIANRTREIIEKVSNVTNKTIPIPPVEKIKACIEECVGKVPFGVCVRNCFRMKIKEMIQAENVSISVFINKTKVRLRSYLNLSIGKIISEIVRSNITEANLTGIDNAIYRVGRVIKILQVVREHLKYVNASPIAIAALNLSISNVNRTLHKLKVVKELVREVKELRREAKEKIKRAREKLQELIEKLRKIEERSKEDVEKLLNKINETLNQTLKEVKKYESMIEEKLSKIEKNITTILPKGVEKLKEHFKKMREKIESEVSDVKSRIENITETITIVKKRWRIHVPSRPEEVEKHIHEKIRRPCIGCIGGW